MFRCYIQHTYSIQIIVFRKKYRTMERKKRSKGSVWEFCYANKIFGMFEEEMRAYGQKWVTFCTHTHTHAAKLVVMMYISLQRVNGLVTHLRTTNIASQVSFLVRSLGISAIFILLSVKVKIRLIWLYRITTTNTTKLSEYHRNNRTRDVCPSASMSSLTATLSVA